MAVNVGNNIHCTLIIISLIKLEVDCISFCVHGETLICVTQHPCTHLVQSIQHGAIILTPRFNFPIKCGNRSHDYSYVWVHHDTWAAVQILIKCLSPVIYLSVQVYAVSVSMQGMTCIFIQLAS